MMSRAALAPEVREHIEYLRETIEVLRVSIDRLLLERHCLEEQLSAAQRERARQRLLPLLDLQILPRPKPIVSAAPPRLNLVPIPPPADAG